MTKEGLEKIKELAELKIQIDRMPPDSLLTLRMSNNFLILYKQMESIGTGLMRQDIDDLINTEIERLTKH